MNNELCTEAAHMSDGKLPIIQKLLFDMLCEVDSICKAHNIKYFLAGGTLLGAVRNHGFIPWDDDIDIMMLRDDFEHFLKVARNELPEKLFLQTPVDENGCHYLNAKIRLNGTVFSSEFLKRFPSLHNGLFLDIVAHDYTANSLFGQKLHINLTLLARGLVFKKWSGESVCKVKRKIRYFIFDFLKWVLPFSFLEWFQKRVLMMFNGKRKKYLYDGMGTHITNGAFPSEWLKEAIEIEFERKLFPIPAKYDEYLTFLYGDYMNINRPNTPYHNVVEVDLGEYSVNENIMA